MEQHGLARSWPITRYGEGATLLQKQMELRQGLSPTTHRACEDPPIPAPP